MASQQVLGTTDPKRSLQNEANSMKNSEINNGVIVYYVVKTNYTRFTK
jgi:hypothetical protein